MDHLECILPAGGDNTTDAAVLEVDLTPFADGTLRFDYIFASEEYPEWLTDLKNDAVAIFVDGENKAWIPNTTPKDPVSVSTVNSQENDEYFQDNPKISDPNNVFLLAFDGFTSNTSNPWLTTESVSLTENTPVYVKIVIADEDDENYDSMVLLKPHVCSP